MTARLADYLLRGEYQMQKILNVTFLKSEKGIMGEYKYRNGNGVIILGKIIGTVVDNSLNVFEARYQPPNSIVLSAKNIARRGSRLYPPLYVSGNLVKQFGARD
jgi:hypothetical protein